MEAKELFKDAQILFMQSKHKESIEAFTRALEAGAEPFIAYLSRGAAYLKIEELDRAVEDFTKAIELDNQNPRVYYYRGTAHMIKEDYEKAVSDLSKAIELNPEHGAAIFARGTCYAQMEMDDEAVRDIKTATSISETAMQSFADTFGIIRTHFDGVMALLSGERRPHALELTEKETEMIKKWLEEEP